MHGKIKNTHPVLGIFILSLLFLGATLPCYALTIEIDVAPNTLNIQSQGSLVTVHTNISYYAVASSTVTLNGIDISFSKADNRGNFVAKFEMSEVKDLINAADLELGTITLTLLGTTTNNEEFTGSQEITVVNISPAGKN